MTKAQFVLLLLMVVNGMAFLFYGIDKWLSTKKMGRISERFLLLLAIIGGSVGALSGMLMFRHKTKHKLFIIGIPAILLLQIAAGLFLISKT